MHTKEQQPLSQQTYKRHDKGALFVLLFVRDFIY